MKTADSTHICPFTCIHEGDAQETIAEENACRGFYTANKNRLGGGAYVKHRVETSYTYMEEIVTGTAMLAGEN